MGRGFVVKRDLKGRGFSGAGLREGRGFGVGVDLMRSVAIMRGGGFMWEWGF